MEAARNFEMSVNFYQTAVRNNPEDSHLDIAAVRSCGLTTARTRIALRYSPNVSVCVAVSVYAAFHVMEEVRISHRRRTSHLEMAGVGCRGDTPPQ
jgi:hypothetical protein